MSGLPDRPRVSVVIPVLDDVAPLIHLLDELSDGAARGFEVIVVDGGSADGSADAAAARGARLVEAAAGRGIQLAAGARAARGTWLWLLHADSSGIARALDFLLELGAAPAQPPEAWGRFDVYFPDGGAALKVVAWFMNQRSRLTGICTGDQGMFVHADLLCAAGGVPEQPLMEDVELSSRLKRLGAPMTPPEVVFSSARRWQRRGVAATVVSMWRFRLRYWLGADPARLAREYYGQR